MKRRKQGAYPRQVSPVTDSGSVGLLICGSVAQAAVGLCRPDPLPESPVLHVLHCNIDTLLVLLMLSKVTFHTYLGYVGFGSILFKKK